jgi:hypothetical protein
VCRDCVPPTQLYSDDTLLTQKGGRSAYPLYAVPVNGSFELYKLLFPVSVVAYLPVMECPLKGGCPPPPPPPSFFQIIRTRTC